MQEKGYSRIGRALIFIIIGRQALNLSVKISNYCSALESIFTTDSNEISHKLSERIAFFLSQYDHVKMDVYKTIKKAYSIRSKLVHGDTLNNKLIGDLPDICFQCDEYLRKIVMAILEDKRLLEIFESNNQNVENYFNTLILQ